MFATVLYNIFRTPESWIRRIRGGLVKPTLELCMCGAPHVGHSNGRRPLSSKHFWDTHTVTLLWHTICTHYFDTLLWHYCDTPMWHNIFTNYCDTLLWHTFAPHYCDTMLWHTTVTHYCYTLLRHTTAKHYCYTLPLHTVITHYFYTLTVTHFCDTMASCQLSVTLLWH